MCAVQSFSIRPPSWIKKLSLQKLLQAFPKDRRDTKIHFVGGCVRDSLLNFPIQDIDLATSYLPEEVLDILKKASIKVSAQGIRHGTVTAILGQDSYQITTLRKDVNSYGRQADVSFIQDWKEDASRRDFTINALYLSVNGEVTDYFGGLSDLATRKVRFIGDASDRIKEDFLRILRFFRFHAFYGQGTPSQDILDTIQCFSSSLRTLSKERITEELLKLFSSSSPSLETIVNSMADSQCLENIFGLKSGDIQCLRSLKNLETRYQFCPSPLLRLTSFFHVVPNLCKFLKESLRLSNKQKKYLHGLTVVSPLTLQRSLYTLGKKLTIERALLATSLGKIDEELLQLTFDRSSRWVCPRFPLKGNDLKNIGFSEGITLGRALKEIEQYWAENNFTPTKSCCLNFARSILISNCS